MASVSQRLREIQSSGGGGGGGGVSQRLKQIQSGSSGGGGVSARLAEIQGPKKPSFGQRFQEGFKRFEEEQPLAAAPIQTARDIGRFFRPAVSQIAPGTGLALGQIPQVRAGEAGEAEFKQGVFQRAGAREERVREKLTTPLRRVQETSTNPLAVFAAQETEEFSKFFKPQQFLATTGAIKAGGAALGAAARTPVGQRAVRKFIPKLGKKLVQKTAAESAEETGKLAAKFKLSPGEVRGKGFVTREAPPKAFPVKKTQKLLENLNKALGKAGRLGGKKSKEQLAAESALKADISELRAAAAASGKEFVSFLKEQGLDDATIGRITQLGGTKLGGISRQILPKETQKGLDKLAAKEPTIFERRQVSTEIRRKLVSPEAKGIGEKIIAGEEGLTAAAGDIEAANLIKEIIDNPNLQGDLGKILDATTRFKKFGAEIGRALQARKEVGKGLNAGIIKNIKKEIAKTTDVVRKAQLESILEDAKKLVVAKPAIIDFVLEAWTSGILSNPATAARNLLGNAVAAVAGPVDRFTQAIISKIPGTKNKAFIREAGIEAATLIKTLPNATRVALANLVTEKPEALVETIEGMIASKNTKAFTKAALRKLLPSAKKLVKGIVSRTARIAEGTGAPRGVFTGKAGEVIRSPFRILRAGDEAGFIASFESVKRALSFRHLKSTGQEVTEKAIIALANKPTKAIEDAAAKEALQRLFQAELGKAGKSFSNFLNTTKATKFVIPFFKTIINLTKFTADHSPIGFLTNVLPASVRAGGLDAAATAKAVNGTILATGTFLWLKSAGVKVIPAAKTSQERASLQRRGLQESSLLLPNGTNIGFRNLEPITPVLEGIANIMEAQKREKKGQPSDLNRNEAIERFTKSMANESLVSGVKRFLDQAFEPNERGFRNFMANFGSSFIPNVVSGVAKIGDPFVREAGFGSFGEALQRRTPGLRKKLPIAVDVFGAKRKRLAAFSPLKFTKQKFDPVEEKLAELKVFPGLPKLKQKGVTITKAERREILTRVGPATKRALNQLITDPRFDAAPPELQKTLIKSVFNLGSQGKSIVVKELLNRKRALADPKERARIDFEFKNR